MEDYIAWKGKHWTLKRLTRYLPKDYELLYSARQILIRKSHGVDQAIKNVTQKLKNDTGINYDRLKWRMKKRRIESAIEILIKIKNNKNKLVKHEKSRKKNGGNVNIYISKRRSINWWVTFFK